MHNYISLVTHFSYPFSNSHFLFKNQFLTSYTCITYRVGNALRCILRELLAKNCQEILRAKPRVHFRDFIITGVNN